MCRWLWRRRTTASSSLSCEGSLRRCCRRPFRISCSTSPSGCLGHFLPYPFSPLPPCCSLACAPCCSFVCAPRVVPNCLTFTPHKTHTSSNHPKLRHFGANAQPRRWIRALTAARISASQASQSYSTSAAVNRNTRYPRSSKYRSRSRSRRNDCWSA